MTDKLMGLPEELNEASDEAKTAIKNAYQAVKNSMATLTTAISTADDIKHKSLMLAELMEEFARRLKEGNE